MSIISFEFLSFLFLVLFVYYLFPIKKQWVILLLFSMLFYLINFNIVYILITSLSTYFVSYFIGKNEKRIFKNLFLFLGIFINIFLLIVLKYDLFKYIKGGFSLIIPLGISYYTLSSISYMVDVYKCKIKVENYFKLLLSLSFFPTLFQGPIGKYSNLKETLFEVHKFNFDKLFSGFLRILWGFFKKLVIVSRLSILTSYVVSNNLNGIFVILGLLLYAIEIYADFSSGIDIVIGFSKMLQVDLEENFNVPYVSKSLNEFWKRWHISLTSWYREYIYIPLGGNRCSKFRNIINIMIVFVLSGMWHGTTINFFLWGLLNGIILVIEKMVKYNPQKKIFVLFNYFIVSLLWIFFLYVDFDTLLNSFISIFNFNNYNILSIKYLDIMSISNYIVLFVSILFLFFVEYIKNLKREFVFKYRNCDYILLIVFVFIIILLGVYGIGFEQSDFIYNRF